MPDLNVIRTAPAISNLRIGGGFLFALWLSFWLVASHLSAQENFSFRSAAEKLSITRLFKSKPESTEKPAEKTNQHPIQPTPLKVVDRATAMRMANQPNPTAADPRYAVADPIASNRAYAQTPSAENSQSEHSAPNVQATSYQQPLPHAPKVYSTPSMNGRPFMTPPDGYQNGYPPPAAYGYHDGFNGRQMYPPQPTPNYPPAFFDSNGQLSPPHGKGRQGNGNQPSGLLDAPLPSVPSQQPMSGRPSGVGNRHAPDFPENWDAPPLDYESVMENDLETLPPPLVQNQRRSPPQTPSQPANAAAAVESGFSGGNRLNDNAGYPSNHQAGYQTNNRYDAGAGRGYLQNGSGLQGRRLYANPQSATERALEIQAENDRLKETITRTQLELDNRNQELADARSMYRRQEEELAKSMTRINELNAQLLSLNGELKIIEQDKQNIQRRSEEQLKAIENTLDGVLLNSITRSGDKESP